jgi:hypothetical protein
MLLLEGVAAVVTKIASASTVAQVATGLGITVAGVTGAGASGVLPGPVQDGVAGAIEAVSPFDVPDSADDRVRPVVGVHGDADGTGADGTGHPGQEDSQQDDAAGIATPTASIPVVAAPTAEPTATPTGEIEDETAEDGTAEIEDETGDDGGEHQHRGGRTEATVDNSGPGNATSRPTASRGDDDPESESESEPEDSVGEDHGGHHGSDDSADDSDDDSGHNGSGHGDSGSGSGHGDDSRDD